MRVGAGAEFSSKGVYLTNRSSLFVNPPSIFLGSSGSGLIDETRHKGGRETGWTWWELKEPIAHTGTHLRAR